jgi:gas vesicle protein
MFGRKPPIGKYMLMFALGAVTGAAVALLYAPMTGRKMQKKVGDVTDKVIDATDKVLDKMEEKVENMQHFVKKIANA